MKLTYNELTLIITALMAKGNALAQAAESEANESLRELRFSQSNEYIKLAESLKNR